MIALYYTSIHVKSILLNTPLHLDARHQGNTTSINIGTYEQYVMCMFIYTNSTFSIQMRFAMFIRQLLEQHISLLQGFLSLLSQLISGENWSVNLPTYLATFKMQSTVPTREKVSCRMN